MAASAVSLPPKDSARLKTRSHSMRASACRLLVDPSRQCRVAWCPSFPSASATSSSTSFLSRVRVSGALSPAADSSSSSSHRSYRTMTFSVPTRAHYNRRMKKFLMFLVGAVSLAAASCGGTKPGDEFTMKDQASIRERSDAFVKGFNEKDVAQVLALYAENSVFMPPNQPVIRGKDALRS